MIGLCCSIELDLNGSKYICCWKNQILYSQRKCLTGDKLQKSITVLIGGVCILLSEGIMVAMKWSSPKTSFKDILIEIYKVHYLFGFHFRGNVYLEIWVYDMIFHVFIFQRKNDNKSILQCLHILHISKNLEKYLDTGSSPSV